MHSWYQLFRSEYNEIKTILGPEASDADVVKYLNSLSGENYTELEILD